ncbi:putative protein MSS51 homolog, mitochondrial [Penaeus vannamei]|uniref:putative protein MSS51 homolog, mitochondrial n=1 Tax=Penaeus vannamei TaxID=6689 RepID=UPI00387FA7E0
MTFELKEYPPRSFSEKYQKYLAPHGILQPPQLVLKNKKLGNNAEDTLKKAFKITVKKLAKMRSTCANCNSEVKGTLLCPGCKAAKYCSEKCRYERKLSHAMVCEALRLELIDQIVECLPTPVLLGRDILRGRGGLVKDWKDWFTRHTCLEDNIKAGAEVVSQWWAYTGVPHPGEESIRASLERWVSNVFSTVLTIGHCPIWLPGLQTSLQGQGAVHIHLLGADLPEVNAVESGLIQVSSRVLGQPLVVTLVAPDLAHHPQTFSWTPRSPNQVTPGVRAVAYPGLYHDFWRDHIATPDAQDRVPRPHVALAIHPGVHTDEMLELWKPTLQLLAYERVPVVMTTYNKAEFQETLEKLEPLRCNFVHKDLNPLRSLLAKQTPYEPDHVWASNSYVIAIDNSDSPIPNGSSM